MCRLLSLRARLWFGNLTAFCLASSLSPCLSLSLCLFLCASARARSTISTRSRLRCRCPQWRALLFMPTSLQGDYALLNQPLVSCHSLHSHSIRTRIIPLILHCAIRWTRYKKPGQYKDCPVPTPANILSPPSPPRPPCVAYIHEAEQVAKKGAVPSTIDKGCLIKQIFEQSAGK